MIDRSSTDQHVSRKRHSFIGYVIKTNWPFSAQSDLHIFCFNVRMLTEMPFSNMDYPQVSNIRRTKSQHLKDSRIVMWLSLANPLKPDVKSRMKMKLEQRRQAMLQLHLSDRQFITYQASYIRGFTVILMVITRRSKLCDEIIHPSTNFNVCTVKVLEWISNSIPQFVLDVSNYPHWDWSQSMVSKGDPDVQTGAIEITEWSLTNDCNHIH